MQPALGARNRVYEEPGLQKSSWLEILALVFTCCLTLGHLARPQLPQLENGANDRCQRSLFPFKIITICKIRLSKYGMLFRSKDISLVVELRHCTDSLFLVFVQMLIQVICTYQTSNLNWMILHLISQHGFGTVRI